MNATLSLLPLLLFAPHQKDAARDFQKAFRPARHSADAFEVRKSAIERIEGSDTRNTAELFLDAWVQLEKEARPEEDRRRSYIERGRKDFGMAKRPDLDAARELQEMLAEAMLAFGDPDAREFLVQRALENKKLSLYLRAQLAPMAERTMEGNGYARRALSHAKKPADKLTALIAIESVGERARDALGRTLQSLSHPDECIREAAADALATLRAPDSLAPLIDRLGQESGRTRRKVADALEILTRQKIGTSQAAWRRWLDKEGQSFLSGEQKLGGGTPGEVESTDGPRYHGIRVDGESILFLVDRSNSMKNGIKAKGKPAEGEPSRFVRAKDELCKVLESLGAGKRFNVVAFAGSLKPFDDEGDGEDGLLEAAPENIERAVAWVRALKMEFGTHIYDAFDQAFVRAGRPVDDGYYDSRIDTVFLLTDGQPYVGTKADKKPRILAALRRWNLQRRVKINVIGLGKDIPTKFLRKIAAEHGGECAIEDGK